VNCPSRMYVHNILGGFQCDFNNILAAGLATPFRPCLKSLQRQNSLLIYQYLSMMVAARSTPF
jgi:hypothetical protein